MSFPASSTNLKLGRGALFIDRYSGGAPTGAFAFVGNVSALELTSENETQEKFSSTQASSPLLDRRVTRQSFALAATVEDHRSFNLALFMSAELGTENQAGASQSTTILAVTQGKYYKLPHSHITGVTVEVDGSNEVADTDYTVDLEHGVVQILTGGGIPTGEDIVVKYTSAALTRERIRGGKEPAPNVEVLYIADDANADGIASGDRLRIWKASARSDGAYGFIADEYGGFGIALDVLSDADNHPTEPFYVIERDPAA